jgi:2',3'-cyclic-nucleotide 2'-phosphodiesterase (5'-nucleotidase family)
VKDIVDRPLAEAVTNLSKMDMVLIAEAAFLESTGADYAHQNSGGTRGAIKKGAFSYRTIWSIFPFENTLVTTEMPGKDIPQHFYGHKPIDPAKTYRVVTNSFVRDQELRYVTRFCSILKSVPGSTKFVSSDERLTTYSETATTIPSKIKSA